LVKKKDERKNNLGTNLRGSSPKTKSRRGGLSEDRRASFLEEREGRISKCLATQVSPGKKEQEGKVFPNSKRRKQGEIILTLTGQTWQSQKKKNRKEKL